MTGFSNINPHLSPFLPYVEKSSHGELESGWHEPNSLSDPINVDLIRSWLGTCDTHHSDHCQGWATNAGDPGPSWLVHVHRRCIVPAEPGVRYATLSYVWGQAACTSLMKETIEVFEKDASLMDPDLPKTISDSMKLTAALGLTYLWVDRLCIVQDDISERTGQLKAMGSIYAQSYLTIVAAQSHDAAGPLSSRRLKFGPASRWTRHRTLAGHNRSEFTAQISTALSAVARLLPRLPGAKSSSSTGTPSPAEKGYSDPQIGEIDFWAGPKTHIEVMNIMARDLMMRIWFSRGWTFQEFVFSKRKVLFHQNTVNWECHCASAHEHQRSLRLEPCQRQPFRTSLGVDDDPGRISTGTRASWLFSHRGSSHSPRMCLTHLPVPRPPLRRGTEAVWSLASRKWCSMRRLSGSRTASSIRGNRPS